MLITTIQTAVLKASSSVKNSEIVLKKKKVSKEIGNRILNV